MSEKELAIMWGVLWFSALTVLAGHFVAMILEARDD